NASWRGETPMLRTWKSLSLFAVLLPSLAASAQATDGPPAGDNTGKEVPAVTLEQRLEALEKAYSKSIEGIRQDFTNINKEVGNLQAQMLDLTRKLQFAEDKRKIEERLDKLHTALEEVKSKAQSTSLKAPESSELDALSQRLAKLEAAFGRLEQAFLKLERDVKGGNAGTSAGS